MKEFIKVLDDLRSEDERFDFNPLNRNLCFGGGTARKIIKKSAETTSGIASGIESGVNQATKNLQSGVMKAGQTINTGLEKGANLVGGLAEDAKGVATKMAKDVIGAIAGKGSEAVGGGGTGAGGAGIGETTVAESSSLKQDKGQLGGESNQKRLNQKKDKLKVRKVNAASTA